MKKVGDCRYVHISALEQLSKGEQHQVSVLRALLPAGGNMFNVVKIDTRHNRISLLNYGRFFEDPFPVLLEAWTTGDWSLQRLRYTDYRGRDNPPVLHRKELLLPNDHWGKLKASMLTTRLEKAGLLKNTSGIGTKRAWEKRLRDAGVQVLHNQLVPITPSQGDTT